MTAVQKNSFDLLRLCAAALVLYGHQYVLLGLAELESFRWFAWSGVRVLSLLMLLEMQLVSQ